MMIGPRDIRTGANERAVIRTALETLIKNAQRRLRYTKSLDGIEKAEHEIAMATDLLEKFKG